MSNPVPSIVVGVVMGLTTIVSIVLSVLSFTRCSSWMQPNGKETSSFGYRWGLLAYWVVGFIYTIGFIVVLVLSPERFDIAAIFLLALLVLPKCTLVYPIFKTALYPLPEPTKPPGPGAASNLIIVCLQLLVGAVTLVLLGTNGKAGIITLIVLGSVGQSALGDDYEPSVRSYNTTTIGYGAVVAFAGLVLLYTAIYAVRRPKDSRLSKRQLGAPRAMIWAAILFTLSGIIWMVLGAISLNGRVNVQVYRLTVTGSAVYVASVFSERVLDLAIFAIFIFVFKREPESKGKEPSSYPYAYTPQQQGVSLSPVSSVHHMAYHPVPVPMMTPHSSSHRQSSSAQQHAEYYAPSAAPPFSQYGAL